MSPDRHSLTNLSKNFFAQCCTLLSYFTPGEIGRAQSPISLPLSLKPRKARKKGLPACLVIRFGQSPSEIRPILPAGSSFVAKVLCRSSRLCLRSLSVSAISQQLPRGLNPAHHVTQQIVQPPLGCNYVTYEVFIANIFMFSTVCWQLAHLCLTSVLCLKKR